MPDKNKDAEAKLQKLGKRIRESVEMLRPADEIRREQLREYIRDEWDREQETKRTKAAEPDSPSPKKEREPEEPGPER